MLAFLRVLGAFAPAILLAQSPQVKPPAAAPKSGLFAVIETSMGTLRAVLYEKQAPVTVKNFADLAGGKRVWTDPRIALPVRKPFYDGLTFHRVLPESLIQGGDPLGNGAGATKVIPDEIDPSLRFDRPGRLAMANSGPNTASCQFFITAAPAPHLQGLHTIFGQVVEGLDTITAISRVPARQEQPLTPVTIRKITIERLP